jgi:glycosyltransferase involved in cell wall biosynthesis
MRPRIGHVLSYLAARYGGPPAVALTLGRFLNDYGFRITYWGTGSQSDRLQLSSLGPCARIFDTRWPHQWFRSPELARELARMITNLDLLHLHEPWTHPIYAASKIAQSHAKPYLVTIHGDYMPWRYRGLKKRLYTRVFARRILEGATCIHAITYPEVDALREMRYVGPVTVIPNGIDVEEFDNLPDPSEAEALHPELLNKRVVHFLSRLSPEKGLDQLIPAWAHLVSRRSYKDCMLVLSGPGDRGYDKVVKEIIFDHNLQNSVLLTGMVTGTHKLSLISRSDIYVLPSYAEGFSVSLLENLAAGKPVLTTPGCHFPDVTEVGAGICVPPESDALADGLRRLLDMSSEDLQEMGARGRCLVLERYRLEVIVRKLITVYNCILQGNEIPMDPEPVPVDQNGKAIL